MFILFNIINSDVFSNLLINLVVLVALVPMSTLIHRETSNSKLSSKILNGFILGVIIFIVMHLPWLTLDEGALIFDSRSIIIIISTLFYSNTTTFIVAGIGIIIRIFKGISENNYTGMWLGIYSIIIVFIVTYFLNKVLKKIKKMSNSLSYYLLGLFSHIALTIPFLFVESLKPYLFEIVIAHILLYPIIVLLISIFTKKSFDTYKLSSENLYKENLIEAVINATQNMEIYALDTKYRYINFNKFHKNQMEKFYNIKLEKGMCFFDIIQDDRMIKRIKESIDKALSETNHSTITQVEINPEHYIEEQYSSIRNDQGDIIGVTIFCQDISDKKQRENEIFELGYYDSLTKLYNRRAFQETLDHYLKDENHLFSLVYIDINGLKQINDSFGHKAGDELLKLVASTIKGELKDFNELAYRIGGDEFVIILNNMKLKETTNIVENIKNEISKIKIKYLPVSISYGCSVKTPKRDIEVVLKEAEDIMYKNKIFEVSSHRSKSIKTILSTLKEKDFMTEKHSNNVGLISESIGKELKMNGNDLNALKLIANLHDIGKIGIDDSVLNKTGKLTEKEFEEIKKHPEIGYRILSTIPEYLEIANDVLSHHERYDGKGYPRGLKGNEIPIRARIIGVADAYDAMISERPYRVAMTKKEAIQEIKDNSGTQFDPIIVEAFLKII